MTATEPVDVAAWVERSIAQSHVPLMHSETFWDNGLLVRLFDGPTAPERSDFHINQVPEFFYQLAGTLELRTLQEGQFVDRIIGQGEMFAIEPGLPHRNRRPPGSIGLVIHYSRKPGQTDGIVWYCDTCCREMHRVDYVVGALRDDLMGQIDAFLGRDDLRTCSHCGWVMPDRGRLSRSAPAKTR